MLTGSSAENRISRCAVSKIDLKGRWVVMDERTERLFGHNLEEFFGKPFLNVIAESDQEIIRQIFNRRSHFEAFFESAHINLVSGTGELIPAMVTITLNFIAGNPVNYQIVITPDADLRATAEKGNGGEALGHCISELVAMPHADWVTIAKLTRELTEAKWVVVLRTTPDSAELTPICAVSDDPETLAIETPAPHALHIRCAHTGELYSFANPDQVRKAIERDGFAPNELVARIVDQSGVWYLFRIIFGATFESPADIPRIANGELVVSLIQRLFFPETEQYHTGHGFGSASLVAAFDKTPVSLLTVNGHLEITAAGGVWSIVLGDITLPSPVEGAVNHIAEYGYPELAIALQRYSRQTATIDPCIDRVEIDRESNLVCLWRVNDVFSEAKIMAAIIPERSQLAQPSESNPEMTPQFWEEVRSPLFAAARIVEKLSHEFYDELGRNGNFYLLSLRDKIRRLSGMTEDVLALVDLRRINEEPQPVDLNLLCMSTIEQLSATYPSARIDNNSHDLPKLVTYREAIALAVREIIANSIKFAGRSDVEIGFSADIIGETCRIGISDNGPGISEKYLPRIGQLFFRVPEPWVQALPGRGMGIAKATCAIRAVGGTLQVFNQKERGTVVEFTVPIVLTPTSEPASAVEHAHGS